jgi:hypothetical protein
MQHSFSTPIMIACMQHNNIMFYVFNMYLSKILKMQVDANRCFELVLHRWKYDLINFLIILIFWKIKMD